MFVAEIPQSLQETCGRHAHPTLALYRLDDDGGGLRADEILGCFQVAEGRVDEAAEHRAEALLQGGLAGRREAAVGAAVEGL